MAAIDLGDIPVVDNHCHSLDRHVDRRPDPRPDRADPSQFNPSEFRALFTESADPRMRREDAATTAFYARLIRRMASYHGCEQTEEAVLHARAATPPRELAAALFRNAGIRAAVVDTGYPPPERALDTDELAHATGVQVAPLLRLELLFQRLAGAYERLAELREALRDELGDLRAAGYAGAKSIAGYRTGLGIERWSMQDAASSLASAREEAKRTQGDVRLGHKPLLDTLLHDACEQLARQELVLQFHVGYGDADADLRTANPLHLRALFEEPAYRAMPIVLLHGCWPYVREGAYLAALYGNAHLDLSYAIPFLSRGEMRSLTRAALGVAPFSKIFYSSDGARVPELHWMGARDGREALGTVLGELVTDGDLDQGGALAAGRSILSENAVRLYDLAPLEAG